MEKENIGILFVILDSPKSLPMARAHNAHTKSITRESLSFFILLDWVLEVVYEVLWYLQTR